MKYFLPLIILFIIFTASAQAAGVTLTWTTDTYVPLNYQGMALPSRGSSIEVAAQFNSSKYNPQELIFNWFLNNKIQNNESGLEKQSFKFKMSDSLTKEYIIRLEVTDRNNLKIETSNNLFLKAHQPEIVLKSKNPPLKFSNQYQFSDNQEIEFTALPYFFNIKNADELNYQWEFGLSIVPQVDNVNLNNFILKVGELNETLKQTLQVWAENKNHLIQRTRAIAEIILNP